MQFQRLCRLIGLAPFALSIAACSLSSNGDGDGDAPPAPTDSSADTYVNLGPVSEATVQITILAGTLIGEGTTTAYDADRDTQVVGAERRLKNIDQGRRAGLVRYRRLDLSKVSDSDMVIITATGGRDIDLNDDGIIGSDEGANGPVIAGSIAALVKVADFRSGTVFVNPLTTVTSAAAINSTSEITVAERATRLATFLLKSATAGGDLNADKLVDWRDLYHYDPTQHTFADAASSRSMDAAVSAPEVLPLLLATTEVASVAQAVTAGGDDNSPSKIALRLFGDSNGNGLANVFEDPGSNDVDKDSLVDARDSDVDGDGLSNTVEAGIGLIPWSNDTDHDGIEDGKEDFDGDGLDNASEVTSATDPKKADTDDDGLTDKQEIDRGLNPKDATDGASADSDADGISNAAEIANGLNPKDPADAAQDLDGDGLTNRDEVVTYRTDPREQDTDEDGINDAVEVANKLDPLNPSDGATADSDEDGLTNAAEATNGLDPHDASDVDKDPDGDGISSRTEISTYGTNPKVADTEGDGLKDGDEVSIYRTKPTIADSDGDGLSDGREVSVLGTNPLDPDTDRDSISDGAEINGFLLFDHVTQVTTDPTGADTDNDGIHDGIEKAVQDQFATYASAGEANDFLLGVLNPNNPVAKPSLGGLSFIDTALKAEDLEHDPDGDGKPTIEELFHGTDPNNGASEFAYVYELTNGGARKSKFKAMEAANFVYVPGGWDVDGDGVIEPGFFVAKFEAKTGNSSVSTAPSTVDLLANLLVFNATNKRFTDRLCNNDSGGTSSDTDTSDAAGACRGSQYKGILVAPAGLSVNTAVFTATGLPVTGTSWTESNYILRNSPVDASGSAGGPYSIQLPSDKRWLLISRTVLLNPTNWTSGKVGEGTLFRGHSDNSPASVLPVAMVSDPYDGTGNSSNSGAEQKRTLVISNGVATRDFDLPLNYSVEVWDLSGNVSEWTSGLIAARATTATKAGRAGGDRFAGGLADFEDYTGANLTGADGDASTLPSWMKPLLLNGSSIGTEKGAGAYFDGAAESDTDRDGQTNGSFATVDYGYGNGYRESYSAFVRGGYCSSASNAGVYGLSLDNGIGRRAITTGFRAVADQ